MSVDDHVAPPLQVAAVLVVHDGMEWLPAALGTLAAQRYEWLDLIVVDNASTDGSAELLGRRIPADRLITLPRNVGYGRAVTAGLRHEAVADADAVLLLHDDLVLAPDALERLVHALVADPSVAIVGPKLREWLEEPVLQQVGMTIDRFGRAESGLEDDELDQGQHDQRGVVLYVPTAGMLIRTDVLRQLRGFDPRFFGLRDDLDLCWRAWLCGHRVEVVPQAVGYHVAAGSRSIRRVGKARDWESRYLSERHSLAAVLKNYGALRLLWVLPVALLLTGAKVLAFLLTRRFGAAQATVRAYVWNLWELPRTLRMRRGVQRHRTRADSELAALFAPGLPRLREYGEAAGSWLAGGSTRALIAEPDGTADTDEAEGSIGWRLLKRHPALGAGLFLLVVYLIGLTPLLGGGQLIGGEIKPWPASAWAFLEAYASPWNGEPAASGVFASPAQALLGVASLVGFGSAWLAQRLIVLGLLPLAWILSLRAGRLITSRPGPRVLGATLYVLSPPVLGTLANGHFGALVFAALLPGLVLVGARTIDGEAPPGSAWRAAALLSLGLAAACATAPSLWFLVLLLWVAAVVVASADASELRRRVLVRLAVAGGGALGIVSPWLVDLVRFGVRPVEPIQATPLPAWRAFTFVPEALPGLGGTAGMVVAVASGAVVLAAVLLGLRLRPGAVAGLAATGGASALAAWAAARVGVDWVWPPALLVPGALALGGLAVVAACTVAQGLRVHEFGARQISIVVAAVVLVVGLASGIVRLGAGPWDGLRRNPELVPLFVDADVERVGPYRVLLLSSEDGEVSWDLVGGGGPTMVSYGTVTSRDVLNFLGVGVAGAVGGADPDAGARLGLANVRYVVIQQSEDAAAVARTLEAQPSLEPLPSGGGRVFRVRSWLPRAVVLKEGRGRLLLETSDPGNTQQIEESGLRRLRNGAYAGAADPAPGMLVISEEVSPHWRALADGRGLRAAEPAEEGWPINAFVVPAGTSRIVARAGSGSLHAALLVAQVLLVLAVISLALRPPGFTEAQVQRRVGRTLPAGVAPAAGDGDGDGAEPASAPEQTVAAASDDGAHTRRASGDGSGENTASAAPGGGNVNDG